MNHKLSVLHLEALCNADLLQWTSDKQEVQVVDLVLKLREKMVSFCLWSWKANDGLVLHIFLKNTVKETIMFQGSGCFSLDEA